MNELKLGSLLDPLPG